VGLKSELGVGEAADVAEEGVEVEVAVVEEVVEGVEDVLDGVGFGEVGEELARDDVVGDDVDLVFVDGGMLGEPAPEVLALLARFR